MEALIQNITDSALTASSFWENDQRYNPSRSRLNTVSDGNGGGGWLAFTSDTNQWIQVDLQSAHSVSRVETQGRQYPNTLRYNWVTSYQLATSLTGDEADFEYVTSSADGVVVTFNANSDRDTIVSNSFSPRVARFVRLYPQTWNEYISMRWEVYGCYFGVTCPAISLDASVNAHSYNNLGGSQIQAYCNNDEYFASTNYVRNITANCLYTGVWDIDIEQYQCISRAVVINQKYYL